MWQLTTIFLLRLAQEMIRAAAGAQAGVLNGVWIGALPAAHPSINRNSTLDNITEANYDGYSRQQVVVPAVHFRGGPGAAHCAGPVLQPH